MIREEFDWSEVGAYITQNISSIIIGPSYDERSSFFKDIFFNTSVNIFQIESNSDGKTINLNILKDQQTIYRGTSLDTLSGLRSILSMYRDDLLYVNIDLTSLHHNVIMFLTKVLLNEIKPIRLFATYAEPKEYNKAPSGEFLLTEELKGRKSVPGFAKREKENPVCLIPILGFDGDRLIKLTEELQNCSSVIPIVGFPSFRPGWQTRTLRNSMRAIEALQATSAIQKCSANSIFEVLELVDNLYPGQDETLALAPLGTRPHTMASAIYATRHKDTLILYDHPVEVQKRSIGINRTICYHLTSFVTL